MNTNSDQPAEPPLLAEDIADEGDEPSAVASFPIVGIGASAGGLEAFTQLLKALPADTGMAFVVVQHLAPSHVSALAEILARATRMPVMEVKHEAEVEPNHIYVIPPDRSMIVVRGVLQLLPREGRGAHHPVDQFFRSLAKEQRHQAIGVVLSGTATDGTIGLEDIKAEGGITFAQDATAQHEGMPHSAIASGCVDFVLSPDAIAREIVRIGQHPYAAPEVEAPETDDKPNLAQILQLLYHANGVDFTGYKFNTLYRRVTRRMVFQKMSGLAEYVQHLRQTPAEVDALYQDILISVTSFFRDRESFEALKTQVFPRLIKDRTRHDTVRLWTLGCSTGQEAYSLAMAYTEAAEAAGSSVPLQLFASDLNAAGIEKARAGVYPKDIDQDVSPERLRRFFTELDGSYRISKTIRDACVFSRHNVLADPPFSRIDLISCRNLLIYLEPVLQQRIMPILHYALKPAGCLWLGGSETIGGYRNLFDAEDVKHKIYAKKPGSGLGHGHFPVQHSGSPRAPFVPITARPSDAVNLPREADRILLTKFAPPGVLVNADLDILQYRGDTGPYLAPAPGKASFSLLKMLREGLLVAVRAAVLRAGHEQTPVREAGLRVKSNGGYREVAVEVIPVKGNGPKEGGYLILFEAKDEGGRRKDEGETPAAEMVHPSWPQATPSVITPGHPVPQPSSRNLHLSEERLEKELSATREYLQSVIEQQEAANEELQSANEEVQSANEELQSTNEELDTSKEEIQSSNEELATVNDELNNRNAELNRVNNDLVNLIGSVQMAIVIVGPDLRVRRFTPMAEKLLNLIPTDIGRPLADIKLNLDDLHDLGPLLTGVLDSVSVKEREVRDKHGNWHSMRLHPYRTLDKQIDGVVLVFVDVNAMKRAEVATAHLGAIVTSSGDAIISTNLQSVITSWNKGAARLFGYTADEAIGKPVLLLIPPDRVDEEPGILERIQRGEAIDHYETVRQRKDGSLIDVSLSVSPIRDAAGRISGAAKIARDISERRHAGEALRDSHARFEAVFDASPIGMYLVDAELRIRQVSRKARPVFGDIGELIGRDFVEVIHILWPPHSADDIVARFRHTLETGEPYAAPEFSEERYDRKVREYYDWQIHRVGLPDRQYGVVCYFVDVSERMRLSNELRQYAADLSESDHRKNEFLAMLAHELRNPMAPIRNAVHLLRRSDGSAEAVQSASAMLERQVGQMARLVDDLLDVSRISRGRIELRRARTELASVVHHAAEAARSLVQFKDRELTVSLPPQPVYLNADPTRLAQVLGNLLNNAVKFSDKGGRISLTVERESEQVVIRVRDNGIGIAADQLPRIFDLFMQGDTSLERSVSGLGIGLALVKTLVEMHGGAVEARSGGLGQGSEFLVLLPMLADIPKSLSPEPAAATPAATTGSRILVVDDNRDSAESLALLLELSGNQTQTAHDGLKAFEVAEKFLPDAILLDIGLPELNGYEVCRRIRAQPWGKRMVLIALTGWGQDEDRQKSTDAGFDSHLVKPVDLGALMELLSALLARR